MKKYICIVLSLPLLFSCGNGGKSETDRIKDSLNMVNGGLKGEVGKKDSTIETFIRSFNQIQDNLDQIKDKEKIIDKATKSGEVKSKQEQIVSDIQSIYDLLNDNKKKLAGMGTQLKHSNLKITELQKMMDHLEAQLGEKDGQIADLKNQLEKMNVELSGVKTMLDETIQSSDKKTEKMNTAWYAFGTTKELINQGVLTKEGGFIGIGKSAKLKNDFNKEYFTKVDISVTKEIPLACKKARLLTSHPSGSYQFKGEQGKQIEKLLITNPDDFWGVDKYLVIIIE
jgi:hypothetical protein